jgi:S-DNA-T family DNA segregation ATPase FtsK/SpoIIIE
MAGGGRITRVHGPFVSDAEVEKVVAHLKTQGRPQYLEAVTSEEEAAGEEGEDGAVFDKSAMGQAESDDPTSRRWRSCCATRRPRPPTSSAACRSATTAPPRSWSGWRTKGIVGPANHAGKREILVETGSIWHALVIAEDED